MSQTLRDVPATARRLLVIANETVHSPVLLGAVVSRARESSIQVLVIAPALNTRLHHWMSDQDGAHHAAGERLAACLSALNLSGVDAQGWVGDADPIMAIADALPFFAPDEIVLLTHPKRRSNWLARDVVERARAQFALPVVHVVVDDAKHERRVSVAA